MRNVEGMKYEAAQGVRQWCWRFEVRGWRQKIIGIRRKANGKGCQEFGLRPIGAYAYGPVGSWNAEVGKKELKAIL